jgi:hypothetical protein
MAGFAVELVVRFAGTLLAVTRVRPSERYLIGTARHVDLPLSAGGMTAFPLVDRGLVVRVPLGVDAKRQGERTELAFGLVTITITKISDVRVALARPATQKRLVPYAIGALLAHLAVVIVALVTSSMEPITAPVVPAEPPRRVMTKTLPEPKPKPKKQKKAAKPATEHAELPPSAPTVAHAREQARAAGILGSASLDDLSMITGKVNIAEALADVGPIYDEDAANAKGFGGAGGSFRPEDDPAFDSVKVGPLVISGKMGQNYRLPAHGKFREVERPPIMGLTCDDANCKTIGFLDRFAVRDHVEKKYVDMVKCFERHARKEPRIELTLHFDIGTDGTAKEVHDEGSSAFGRCIVGLVERTKFPSEKPTRVTYPIAFWRT